MEDLTRYLGAVTRGVARVQRDGKDLRLVVATRSYPTGIDDLWDAISTADRIKRWFMPVEGDLRLGGRYQLVGNASGEITVCSPPSHLAVTWEFAGNVSWVTVTLEAIDGATTRLTLEHSAEVPPDFWDQYGAGATGVGWDLGLMGLALHIETGNSNPPEESAVWMASEDGRSFVRTSSDAWAHSAIADGEEEAWAREAAERTRRFYTGEA